MAATAITAALFVLALRSMMRLGLDVQPTPSRERTTVLQFVPPAPARPVPTERPRPTPPRRAVATPASSALAPPQTVPVAGAIQLPATPTEAPPRDTATAPATRPTPAGAAIFAPKAQPIVPTFSGPNSTLNALGAPLPTPVAYLTDPASIAARDSMAGVMVGPVAVLKWRELTREEKEASRSRAAPGLASNGRAARLPGEPMYAPLMSGGSSVAIAVPISVQGGPSRKERRRADSLNAIYQARLVRLQNLAFWRRDSLRADSLRRDSIARARIRP